MHTRPLVHIAAALAVAALAVVAVRPAAGGRAAAVRTFTLHDTIAYGRPAAVAPAYDWPVKPFDRQHPVRAFLDDPRIGHEGGESFHFGIDVAAPDGTPVYAVAGGELYLSHGSLCVVAGSGHTFGYWHVRAAAGLRERQLVRRHQLLGTIAPGWGHVHFDERIGRVYVNPLRPGALGPYTDPVAPTVSSLSVLREGRSVALVVRAHDTTWPPVPGAWAREPVTPALLRWRLGTTGGWHVAADFRRRVLDRHAFGSVYAPGTRQNHEGASGSFAFYLARSWHPVDGTYRIQVQAADTRGNRATAEVRLTFARGEVLP
jgi:murein DD-endopeptidase MepM/ murein hydrolase activator NlpD